MEESLIGKYPARLHETSSPLIYTQPGPMSRPQGPCTSGGSKSESPVLTTASLRYKAEVFRSDGTNSTNILTNTTTETHTQDLKLFRCELSKVA